MLDGACAADYTRGKILPGHEEVVVFLSAIFSSARVYNLGFCNTSGFNYVYLMLARALENRVPARVMRCLI